MLLRDARSLLKALEDAYDGLAAFYAVTDDLGFLARRWRRYFRYEREAAPFGWPTAHKPAHEVIGTDDVLILQSVELQSPGYIEVLGALNPLEFIRRSLNDRHQRKPELWREAEPERAARLVNDNLELRNERLALENVGNRLDLEREFDIPRTELTSLYRRYVAPNLQVLGDTMERLDATPGVLREVEED
jgi:hypothetical protein